jgi:CRP/FNR family transcriptional regulator, cyclic AMP receptor protein
MSQMERATAQDSQPMTQEWQRVTVPEPLTIAGPAGTMRSYRPGETVFRQGDAARDVLFIHQGAVRCTVLSRGGREAVVALHGTGDFFGEGCLGGRPLRTASAITSEPSLIRHVDQHEAERLLRHDPKFAERFLSHVLKRNARMEDDLLDQLFNTSEQRLARALLLLAERAHGESKGTVPRLSQETLAELIGTTRSRVNLFLNRFRKLGFIDYDAGQPMRVHHTLSTVLDN